jgi:hypothetical protein
MYERVDNSLNLASIRRAWPYAALGDRAGKILRSRIMRPVCVMTQTTKELENNKPKIPGYLHPLEWLHQGHFSKRIKKNTSEKCKTQKHL